MLGYLGETHAMTIHSGSLPSLANSEKDNLLQSATLLLADEFFELDEHGRKEIASVKLYLTDKELLVANFKPADSQNQRAKLSYLRTHLLSDIEVEVDSEDASSMRIRETNGHRRRFLYRLRQGAAGLALWMSRICKNKCSCVAAVRSKESFTTTEQRAGEAQSDLHQDNAAASEVAVVELPRGEKCTKSNGLLPPAFNEWHGRLESEI